MYTTGGESPQDPVARIPKKYELHHVVLHHVMYIYMAQMPVQIRKW
jgi:hypothetical protein